jgi:hypothetical protein
MSDPDQPGSPKPKGDGPTAMFRLKLDGWMEEMFNKDTEDAPPQEGAAQAPPVEAAAAPPTGEAGAAEPPPKPKLVPLAPASAPGFATAPVQPPKR